MSADDAASVYRAICESMTTGVMLIDAQGRIETFNPFASSILGLEREEVLHRSFAEAFIGNAAFEELSQAVLEAVYEGAVGLQCVVAVRVAGRVAHGKFVLIFGAGSRHSMMVCPLSLGRARRLGTVFGDHWVAL